MYFTSEHSYHPKNVEDEAVKRVILPIEMKDSLVQYMLKNMKDIMILGFFIIILRIYT